MSEEKRKQVGEFSKKLTEFLEGVDSEVAISSLLAAASCLAVLFEFDRDEFVDTARQNFVMHFAAKEEVNQERKH
jgi:hypothetical protein